MDEKETKEIQESLKKIQERKELALKRSQEELAKINQGRDSKTYAEGEIEVNARKKEIEKLNSEIESFNKANKDIKDLNVEALKKAMEQVQEKLDKVQEEFAKLDQRKDPKLYAEVEYEISRRQEDLNKATEKYKNAVSKEKDLKDQLKDLKETFCKKYHIDKKAQEKDHPDSENKNSNNKNDENKNSENKDDKNEILAKQIAKKEAEVRASERRMANFGRKGFDGQTELANYKRLMKELEELKSGKVNPKKEFKPERDEKGNLKNPPVAQNTQTVLTKKDEEKEFKPERDEKGNLKNPPVLQDTQTLPTKPAEKEEKLSIIYSGKDNKYIVSNFEKILSEVKFANENDKLRYIKDMTEKLSKPIDAVNFKNKKEKLEYLKNEFNEQELTHIFGDKYEKAMKKMAKTYDPQLLVLLADLDMNFAKKYISELSKDKDEEKEPLPYSMKYNLKGMRKNHKNNKMSYIQRVRTNRMAKQNYQKGVAEYAPDDKNRRWLAIPMIGALAAGGVVATNHDKAIEEPNQDRTPEITNDTPDTSIETTTTNNEIENAVDKALDDTNKDNNNDLSLGSRVKLSDGITYTEDSLGNGVTGKIGEVSWRPAGDYTIDRVAIYYNGTILENISTEGTNVDETVRKYAEQLGIDPSKIEQKAHVCLGEKHNGATGWLNMEEVSMQDLKNNISKTYEELQKEKEANSKQQAQKTSQEQNQDYEGR